MLPSIPQYTTVYHSIPKYTTVYHSISQYTTVYHHGAKREYIDFDTTVWTPHTYIHTCTYTTAIATIIIREYKPHTTGAFLGECGEGLAGCVTHHHTMFPWDLHALPHCLPCQLLCQSEANLDREIIGENQQSSCLTERKNGQTFSLTSHTLRRV